MTVRHRGRLRCRGGRARARPRHPMMVGGGLARCRGRSGPLARSRPGAPTARRARVLPRDDDRPPRRTGGYSPAKDGVGAAAGRRSPAVTAPAGMPNAPRPACARHRALRDPARSIGISARGDLSSNGGGACTFHRQAVFIWQRRPARLHAGRRRKGSSTAVRSAHHREVPEEVPEGVPVRGRATGSSRLRGRARTGRWGQRAGGFFGASRRDRARPSRRQRTRGHSGRRPGT